MKDKEQLKEVIFEITNRDDRSSSVNLKEISEVQKWMTLIEYIGFENANKMFEEAVFKFEFDISIIEKRRSEFLCENYHRLKSLGVDGNAYYNKLTGLNDIKYKLKFLKKYIA